MVRAMLGRELEVARRLVLEAGALVMERYGKVDPESKAAGEPVTEADRVANAHLVAGLREAFPEDGILAEESAPRPEWWRRRRVWCIDPIDGTKEFIKQNGEFAVMVGLADGRDAVLGLVLLPALDLLYYGGPDLGAFRQRLPDGAPEPIRVSGETEFSRMRMAISRSHRSRLVGEMAERLGVAHEIQRGSVGIKLGLVASGEVELYLHPSRGTKRWDACGPDAILRGAGGRLTDFFGRPIDYDSSEVNNTAGLLASNGPRHDDIVAALRPIAEAAGLGG